MSSESASDPTSHEYAAEPLREAARRRTLRAWLTAIDLAVYREVRMLAHRRPQRIPLVRQFSATGEHGALWFAIGAAGIVLDRPRAHRWARASATVGLAYITSTSIKHAIGRQRPAVEDLPHLMETPTGLSFPSSHSSSSFAAARAFGCLVDARLLYGTAAAMAFSRMYLGVHYPSDIAAGAGLGMLIGSAGRS